MSIEDELLQFISANIVPDGNVEVDASLVSSGLIDSLGLIQILGFIEQKYGVSLITTASPEDFESVNSLAAAIRNAGGSAA